AVDRFGRRHGGCAGPSGPLASLVCWHGGACRQFGCRRANTAKRTWDNKIVSGERPREDSRSFSPPRVFPPRPSPVMPGQKTRGRTRASTEAPSVSWLFIS